jgi:methyltransferase (TIGR00027 family)
MFFRSKDGTAQGVAKQRLIETLATPSKRIINDPLACNFVFGAGLVSMMGHKFSFWLTHKFLPGWHEHLIARTRFIDELVQENAINGIEQYVILGAGYDTRAYRLDLPQSLRVFEVDQPEVQKRKRKKLPASLLDNESVEYVSVDFSHQTVSERLIERGFDKSKSTIITLEGVSQYISKEDFSALVKDIASLKKSKDFIFFVSYIDKRFTTNPEECCGVGFQDAAKKFELIKTLSGKAGEPWISFYAELEIERVLAENGFSIKANITVEDLNFRYFAAVERTIPEDQLFSIENFIVAEISED